jgi:hypothetical protein
MKLLGKGKDSNPLSQPPLFPGYLVIHTDKIYPAWLAAKNRSVSAIMH